MGLAAPKNRTKISADPQNTTWANNTSRFGHKILTQQGWTPGASLGATNAAHAAHYTAASSSHIRVFLKDDNLGLGAKRGSERAENFGLAGLASILGRLNGNEEDVKREEQRMEEVGRRAYVARKFGMMNFVSGGFLVGGEIKRKGEIGTATEGMVESETKDKKRKRASDEDQDSSDSSSSESDDEQPKLKRKKKSVDLREEVAKEAVQTSSKSKDKKSKSKKSKKSKKPTSTSSSPSPPPTNTEPLSDKARRKAEKREKRARKAEKKLKKALKKAAKESKSKSKSSSDSSSEDEANTTTTTTAVTKSVPTTGTSTPTAMGLSFSAGGRHAVRQKYIRQKRAAAMDPQALKEIFMIKTPS